MNDFKYKIKALFLLNKKQPKAKVYDFTPPFVSKKKNEKPEQQRSGKRTKTKTPPPRSPKSPKRAPGYTKPGENVGKPKQSWLSGIHDLIITLSGFISGADKDDGESKEFTARKSNSKTSSSAPESSATTTSTSATSGNKHYDYDVEAAEDEGDYKEDTKLLQDEDEGKMSTNVEENKGSTSSLQAGWNISNLIQGTGTLGIPYAISQGGYAAVFAMVLVALITNYTGKMIVDCLYVKQRETKRRVRQGYADLGEHCWPDHGKTVVGCAQILHLFSALVLYLLLISDFLNDIWPHPIMRASCWTAVAGILVLPSVFINDLSRISWLSMFSVFALLFVFTSMIGFSISRYELWDITALPIIDLEGFPIAWCIILFSFVSHPYLPSVEEKMKTPDSFPLVMNVCYAIAMIFKIAFGTTAVLTFGTNTMQEVSENLPFGPLKTAIDTFLGFNGMFSYALPSFALINIIDKCKFRLIPQCYSTEDHTLSNKELIVNSLLRIFLVLLSVTVAVMVPEFSLLMAVVGSVSAVLLVLVFPALFHMNLKRNELSTAGFTVDIVIIVIGFFSTIFGLFFSVKKLIKVYKLDF